MVKVMLEEGNNVEDDGIINTRTKVEVSFVGYGIFLIRLIVQKSSRGRWWLIIRAITIFVGFWLRVVGVYMVKSKERPTEAKEEENKD